MHRQRHAHHHNHHPWQHHQEKRSPEEIDLPLIQYETIERRAATSSSEKATPTPSCHPGNNSPMCEKSAASTGSTLPIVLGSAIPIVVACIVLYLLHRRHLKKLRLEELHDKTKSMDFGMAMGTARKTGDEKQGKGRQVSMDLDLTNPYVLPGALRGSRESLQSLSKALDANDLRYGLRPGTSHSRPGTSQSQLGATQKNYAPSHHSNLAHATTRESSIYEIDSPNGSTSSMSDELLSKAQGMAMSSPPPPRSPLSREFSKAPELRMPPAPPAAVTRPASPGNRPGLPGALQAGIGIPHGSESRDSYMSNDSGELHHSHQHLAPHITTSEGAPQRNSHKAGFSMTVSAPPPQIQGAIKIGSPELTNIDARPISDASYYEDDSNNGIQFRFSTTSEQEVAQPAPSRPVRDTLAPGAYDNRRLSMGFRPLPPDGTPDESAEERATRIRSFYKEYFDDSGQNDDRASAYYQGGYYEDVTDVYMPQDDSTPVYDQSSDRFMVPGSRPFAEPPTRRAMTPPPRMPQFNSPRASSSASQRFMPPGPRSFTSQSSRFGSPHGQGPPRRAMPPPSPLQNLPTPSQLGEDAFASPIAFAPRVRVQDIVTGRETPGLSRGERPYSPSVPAHIPLASAFEELPTLLAPHALRKSGTYTALDFAPPKKFKSEDSVSDAGSVRSGRSHLNPQQVHHIRAGAYRVSRIPQEVVPMKDDMAAHLKPTMDLSQRY